MKKVQAPAKRRKPYVKEMEVLESRRERRAKARKEKTEFIPQHTTLAGVVTYEEFHGVGYERFNNKFVTIKEVPEDAATNKETETGEDK